MLAASNGHDGVVSWLVEKGRADARAADNGGVTALMLAASNGHEGVVKRLVAMKECGVDVDAADSQQGTALMRAAARGHGGVAASLIEGGADVKARNGMGWRASHFAMFADAEELAATLVGKEEEEEEGSVEARLEAVKDDLRAYREQPLVVFLGEPLDARIATDHRTVTFSKFSTVRFKHGCPAKCKAYYELKITAPLVVPQFGFVTSRLEARAQTDGDGVGDCEESWAVDGV
eukprot:3302101-Rhodomonas_salina.1